MSELSALLDSYEWDIADGLTVNFWKNGNAQYDAENHLLVLPDPDWTALVSGPDYQWEYYWSTVAHEISHAFLWKWYHGLNHREMFYTVLIALHLAWDLPVWSYDVFERNYHGMGYRRGKSMAADMLLDRARSISRHLDCGQRTIYSTQYCQRIFGICKTHGFRSALAGLRWRLSAGLDWFRNLGLAPLEPDTQ